MPTALTLDELDMESAELLPNRETLSCHRGSSTFNYSGGILSNNNIALIAGQQQTGAGNSQAGGLLFI